MRLCEQSPAEVNRPRPYLHQHSHRFYETYKTARELIKNGSSILSIGAGRAFVEYALSAEMNVDVSVLDFPEAIKRNEDQYSAQGFTVHSGNFMTESSILEGGSYDLIFYCEIVEHIPVDPKTQFEILSNFLKPGGYLIISTPNIASLMNVLTLLKGKNIIVPAYKLFSDVALENESVHRREYTLSEITVAMSDARLKVESTRYIQKSTPRMSVLPVLLYAFTSMVSFWRPMMIFTGKKP